MAGEIQALFNKYQQKYPLYTKEAIVDTMLKDGVITPDIAKKIKSGTSLFLLDNSFSSKNTNKDLNMTEIFGGSFRKQKAKPKTNFNRQVEATFQSKTQGDCWLLSDINALNCTEWGRKAIHDAIIPDANNTGGVTIKFKGSPLKQKSFHISANEIIKAKKSGNYAKGDDDMIAFELATEKLSKMIEKGLTTTVGDEGGFAPNLSSTREAIEIIILAIEKAGYNTNNVKLSLDVAASELYEEGECSNGVCSLSRYFLKGENRKLTSEDMIEYLDELVRDYPIISIEDGLAQDDWLGWQNLTEKLGKKCQLVGDDLFVTNTGRLKEGIDKHVANSILIKPNQIGTLTETLDAIYMAQKNGYTAILSHRSGETEDSFIADLAVATNCGLIKTGSISRTDRLAKYNQLLRIEEELGTSAKYLGKKAFAVH